MSRAKHSGVEDLCTAEKIIAGSLGNTRHAMQLNAESVKQAMRSSENDSECYRRMLESPEYTFEEKKTVHGWMVDEREERARLNAEGQRGAFNLGIVLPLLLIVFAGAGFASNPEAAKIVLQKIGQGAAALKSSNAIKKLSRGTRVAA